MVRRWVVGVSEVCRRCVGGGSYMCRTCVVCVSSQLVDYCLHLRRNGSVSILGQTLNIILNYGRENVESVQLRLYF